MDKLIANDTETVSLQLLMAKKAHFHMCSPEDLWRMESGASPHLSVHTCSKQQEGLSIRCAHRCWRQSKRLEREVERTPCARHCLNIFCLLHPCVKYLWRRLSCWIHAWSSSWVRNEMQISVFTHAAAPDRKLSACVKGVWKRVERHVVDSFREESHLANMTTWWTWQAVWSRKLENNSIKKIDR